MPSPPPNSYSLGQLQPNTTWGDYNNIVFAIKQAINKIQTALPVRVNSVTNNGGLSPVGFVNVTPLINQIDGNNNSTPHTIIHNIPYLRIQGGTNAIIIDPEVGQDGICLFCSRDISKYIASRQASPPGSFRKYSFSDGIFIGGISNTMPVQVLQFQASGITLLSPNQITITAPNIIINANSSCSINGNVSINGSLTVTDDVTAQGTSLHTHVHSGVTTGTDNTGEPI